MTKRSYIPLTAAIVMALSMAACSTTNVDGNTGTYAEGNPYLSQTASAITGQVTNIEVLHNRTSGTVGTVAGGAVGALAGSQVGGGSGKTLATVAGAIGGALIGRSIEQNTRLGEGQAYYRVTVRFNDNSSRFYDYSEVPSVRVGDKVRLDGGQLYRL